MAGGVIVVAVVHATRDGGVVVAHDAHLHLGAHHVAAFFGVGAVADDVTETDVFVDPLFFEGFQGLRERLDVAVDVTDDPVTHRSATFDVVGCGGTARPVALRETARQKNSEHRKDQQARQASAWE